MHHPHRTLSSAAVLLLLGLGIGSAATAAVLNDPTRPLLPGSTSASGGDASARANAPGAALVAETAASAQPAAEPTVQSLQIPRDGEPSALVDGQLLRVGDHVGAHAVTAIDAQGLSVRGPSGRERWTLTGVQYLDRTPATRMSETPRRPPPALPPTWGPAQTPPSVQAPGAQPAQAPASWPSTLPAALPAEPVGVTTTELLPRGAPLKLALDMQPGLVAQDEAPAAGAVVPVRMSWAEMISPVPVQLTASMPWSSSAVVQVGRWRQLEQLPHLATPAASTAMQPGQMLAAQRLQGADRPLGLSGAISRVSWTLPGSPSAGANRPLQDAAGYESPASLSSELRWPGGVGAQAGACLLAALIGLAAALLVGSVVGPIPEPAVPDAKLHAARAAIPSPNRHRTPAGHRLRVALPASPLPPPDSQAVRRSRAPATAKETS